MKVCKSYIGRTCIDGNCPIALAAEYAEVGMDVTRSCKECIYYEGCKDCISPDLGCCPREGTK